MYLYFTKGIWKDIKETIINGYSWGGGLANCFNITNEKVRFFKLW